MDFLHTILGDDIGAAMLVILNLIVIESLLSVDNAAVLATMVMDLPKEQRSKALKYGIIGAYVFRGICLILAAWLTKIWWLKILGGLYLMWLGINYFRTKMTPKKEDDTLNKKENRIYKYTLGLMGPFWATVALVEIMDLAFSIDNVFAAVAFIDIFWLICIGLFIGIMALRFVAQGFVKLMEKYKFLETSAFLVILILGVKLVISIWPHFDETSAAAKWIDSEHADLYVSIGTVGIFILPVLTSLLFGWPKRSEEAETEKAE